MNYFIPTSGNSADFVSKAMAEIARQTEESILVQLNEFIARGLLVVEQSRPLLVNDQHSTNLKLSYSVKLKIKDQEYIESLERQVKELSDLVAKLRGKQ